MGALTCGGTSMLWWDLDPLAHFMLNYPIPFLFQQYEQSLTALKTLKDKIKEVLKSDTLDATFQRATEEVSDLPR